MRKKIKFKPILTRIKLNPEQAVLTCSCYNSGYVRAYYGTSRMICYVAGTMKSLMSATANSGPYVAS